MTPDNIKITMRVCGIIFIVFSGISFWFIKEPLFRCIACAVFGCGWTTVYYSLAWLDNGPELNNERGEFKWGHLQQRPWHYFIIGVSFCFIPIMLSIICFFIYLGIKDDIHGRTRLFYSIFILLGLVARTVIDKFGFSK